MSMSNYRLQQHVHLLDFVLFLFHILFFCFTSRDSLLLTRILLRNITTITTDDVHYGSSSATYERVRFIILVSERSVSSDSELLVRAIEQCLALSAAPFPHSHLTLLTATRHVIWKKNRPCICMQYSECTPGWWRKARTASTTKSNSMCALLWFAKVVRGYTLIIIPYLTWAWQWFSLISVGVAFMNGTCWTAEEE